MPSDKHPHGTTFHQSIILAIVQNHGPVTSSEIAAYYKKLTKVEVAYNYQFIVTRRMADRKLIKSGKAKNQQQQKVFEWTITPKGSGLLKKTLGLSDVLVKLARGAK
jgi:predicted transcriptional regulator